MGTVFTIVSEASEIEVVLEHLRASQKVSELKGFDKIRIPDHTSILDAHIAKGLIDVINLLDTLLQ